MSDYQLQAEQEMWDAIAAGDRRAPAREAFRRLTTRYAGTCGYCGRRVRAGAEVLYSRTAPKEKRLMCGECADARDHDAA